MKPVDQVLVSRDATAHEDMVGRLSAAVWQSDALHLEISKRRLYALGRCGNSRLEWSLGSYHRGCTMLDIAVVCCNKDMTLDQ